MKRHPAHKRAVASIIERCKREGYEIIFSNQEIDDLLGLEPPAHGSREEREDYKSARKQGLDNIKRDLLYNQNLLFTGTKKTRIDLPAAGVKYELPDFVPSIYKIPLKAIVQASGDDPSGTNLIEVDTGVIYFIDADFEESFRKIEARLFEETGDSYQMTENPENYAEEVGIRFDCLKAPGIGSGYDFVGDGSYVLDVSKIEKM